MCRLAFPIAGPSYPETTGFYPECAAPVGTLPRNPLFQSNEVL
jgi:hypothetical protein